jgi:acyl carrier protein
MQIARKDFAAYPFINYGLLDAEKSPQEQGYESHAFDIVIAASVLHATRNIKEVLRNIRSLLAPNGLLLLVEETRFHTLFDMGMGLQKGFDFFEDEDLRQRHPLLSKEQWREALLAEGFEDFSAFSNPGSVTEFLGFEVLLARGPSSVKAFNREGLREFLRARLPQYMIPSDFIMLDSLPLSPNGKVDRNALPAPSQLKPVLDKSFVAPRNPTEEILAEIWARTLGVERAGINDHFFESGGDSLLAAQLIVRIREEFQIELPMRLIFETPTVAALSEAILQRLAAQADDEILAELKISVQGSA